MSLQTTITNPSTSSINEQNNEYMIDVGSIVEVLPRTWPGSNKLGGAARVTKCHYTSSQQQNISTISISNETKEEKLNEGDSSVIINDDADENDKNVNTIIKLTHVDVRYTVVGGREKRVPMEYVRAAPQYDINNQQQQQEQQQLSNATTNTIFKISQLRDRSSMRGRCTRCGSLRADCNSCDFLYEEEKVRKEKEEEANRVQNNVNSDGNNKNRLKGVKNTGNKRRRNKTSDILNEFDFNETSTESDSANSSDNDFTDDDDEFFDFSRNKDINSTNTRKSRLFIDDTSSSSSSSSGIETFDYHISTGSSSSSDDYDDDSDILLSKLVKKRTQQLAQNTMLEGTNVIVPTLSKMKQQKRRKKKLYEAKYKKKVQFFRHGNAKQSRRIDYMPKSVLESTLTVGDGKFSNNLQGKRRPKLNSKPARSGKILREQHKEVENSTNHQVNVNAQSIEFQQEESDNELPGPAFPLNSSKESMSDNIEIDDDVVEIDNQRRKPTIGYVNDSDIGENEDEEDLDLTRRVDSSINRPNRAIDNFFSQGTLDDQETFFNNSASQTMHFDNTFIQPEGQYAAEHLPSDMIDQSVNVSFFDLPTFYDSLEKDLRERKIPRANAELRELQKELDIQSDSSNQLSLEKKR